MKKQDTVTVRCQDVKIEQTNRSQPTKILRDCECSVTSKAIFFGNFSTKFKHVRDLEIDSTDRRLKFLDCNPKHERTIECNEDFNSQREVWNSFQRMVEKYYSKREAKEGKEQPTLAWKRNRTHSNAMVGSRCKKERREFGARGRKLPRIINSANSYDNEFYGNCGRNDIDSKVKRLVHIPEDMESDHPLSDEEPVLENDDEVSNSATENGSENEMDQDTNTPTNKQTHERQRLREKIAEENAMEDSESDEEVGDPPQLTTIKASQRVVSPLDNGHAEKTIEKPAKPVLNGTLESFWKKAPQGKRNNSQPTKDTKVDHKTSTSKADRSGFKPTLTLTPKYTRTRSPRLSPQPQEKFFPSTLSVSENDALGSSNKRRPQLPIKAFTPRKAAKTKHAPMRPQSDHYNRQDASDDEDNVYEDTKQTTPPRTSNRIFTRGKWQSGDRFRSGTTLSYTQELQKNEAQKQIVHRGLKNAGNSCYLNSSLQMLFTAKGFITTLDGRGGELVQSVVRTAKDVADTSVFIAASAMEVKVAIDRKIDKFRGYWQHDAHELISDLLDTMHDELVEGQRYASKRGGNSGDVGQQNVTNEANDGGDSSSGDKTRCSPEKFEQLETDIKKASGYDALLPTDEYFRSDMEVCLTCNSCGYSRTKKELYRHFSLSLDHEPSHNEDFKISLQKSLELFFKPEERKIKCEKCENGSTATQTLRLLSRPKALLLHLNRFVVQKQDENEPQIALANSNPVIQKNKAPVELLEHVSIDEFLHKETASENAELKSRKYSLKSLVHHLGENVSSGHYTAHAVRPRVPTNGGETTHSGGGEMSEYEWVYFDDSQAALTSLDDILSEGRYQKTAYMLLYMLGEEDE